MKKLLLALFISFLTIAAVYALLPSTATAGISPSPVMQSAPTSCLRLYQYQVVTNSNNLYYWISATLDGNTLLPPANWTDERNHVITVTGWTASEWGVTAKQTIWLPSTDPNKSLLVGAAPTPPHTAVITYQLVSTCGEKGCKWVRIICKLFPNKYSSVTIHDVTANNGEVKTGVLTVTITNTNYVAIYVEASTGGGMLNDLRYGTGLFSVAISSINNTQCYVPPPTGYFRPVREGELVFDNQRFAEWTVTDTENTLVYAPTAGRVVDVQDKFVEISSTTDLGKYRVISVRAPTDLIGRDIDAGCVLGYFSDAEGVGQDNGVIVYTIVPVSPTIGSRLILTPAGGSCMEAWKCFREIWWEGVPGVTKAITLALPARVWAGYRYSVDFNSAVTAGAVLFQASNPRAETYFNLEIRQQPSGDLVWGPGIIQIDRPDKSDYIVSPTTFADGANRLAWALNPVGAADLHRICVLSLFGGDLAGFCPPPAEDDWVLGQNAVWQGQKARLSDGGWIWKEATIFLPPSPSSTGPQGEDGGVGIGDVDPAAISGRYEARVRMKPLAGSPRVYFEKELAPGVWKTLEVVSVTQEAYYNMSVQFDTGQQFLTIRLRASGGEVLVSEVCSEEEERESELVEPCFGIRPYNPAPLTCNILECPLEQVVYHVRKFHDEAILPPLCKIAYWVNYLYYYALTTVGKPILMYLTTITELIREYGPVRGIVEAFKILLESLWVSLIKPYGGQLVAWLWRVLQPVIDFLGISEYTLKLLQQFFSLLFTLFRKAFVILANGTVGLVRAAWLGFRQGLTATPTQPPVPPESIQLGMELIGYAYGSVLLVPLTVVFAGLIMWKFFFWSLRVLGVVR